MFGIALHSLTITNYTVSTYGGTLNTYPTLGNGTTAISRTNETTYIPLCIASAAGKLYMFTYNPIPDSAILYSVNTSGVATGVSGISAGGFSTNPYPGPTAGTSYHFGTVRTIAIDPTSTFIYSADTGDATGTWKIIQKTNLTTGVVNGFVGSHTALDGSAFVAGTGSNIVFNSIRGMVIDPTGTFLYACDAGAHIIVRISLSTSNATVFAGISGTSGSADAAGTSASFSGPDGIAIDYTGTYLYVTDRGNAVIRRITIATSNVTTIAGIKGSTGTADSSTGLTATFTSVTGIVYDAQRNCLYFGDRIAAGLGTRIRMVELNSGNNAVTTLAGSTTVNGSANGVGTNATFNPGGPFTYQISLALIGNTLFVADTENRLLRAITLPTYAYPSTTYTFSNLLDNTYTESNYTNGIIGCNDGPIATARFNKPMPMAVNPVNGNIYVGDTTNYLIRMITPAGIVSTIAGVQGLYGTQTGSPGTTARFMGVDYFAVNSSGTVLYSTGNNETSIRIIELTSGSYGVTSSPSIITVASGMCIDPSNTFLYVNESSSHFVERIRISDWTTTVFAGSSGTASFADGIGSAARFNNPSGICIDSVGSNLYVGDANNNRIRMINIATSNVTTIAGNGTRGWNGDGNGTAVQVRTGSLAITPNNTTLYFNDSGSSNVRMLDLVNGRYTITTISGINAPPFGQSNGVPSSVFWHPYQNVLYYSDYNGNQIRIINSNSRPNSNVQIKNATGVPITIAGTGQTVVRNSNIFPSLSATDVALLQNTNGNVYTIY
jgi:sugar lactone lactonase YvrE